MQTSENPPKSGPNKLVVIFLTSWEFWSELVQGSYSVARTRCLTFLPVLPWHVAVFHARGSRMAAALRRRISA